MKLRTPTFWYRQSGTSAPFAELFLSALSPLYAAGHCINQKLKTTQKVSIPVVCIGNITAGGSGKTPVALALLSLAKEHNIANTPCFLTRGYGGRYTAPTMADPKNHTYKDVGDEALLLAEKAPTVVAQNRYHGACTAIENKADLIIMDDGLQNPGLHKDVSFLVINGEMGFGNGKLLPAGPLRETITKGLQKTDAVIMIGTDKQNARQYIPKTVPVFPATIIPKTNQHALEPDRSVIAFAGLGYPQKFFGFLKQTYNLQNLETYVFPDHHPYTSQDLEPLIEKAQRAKAVLVTSQKDYMRVPDSLKPHIVPHDIEVVFENKDDVLNFLSEKIQRFKT